MTMKKRLLAILLVVCMVVALVPSVFATGVYTDIKDGDWYAKEIMYVYEKGLMNGVGSDTFNPKGSVTRAMVWTTLARLEGVDTTGSDPWHLDGQKWAMENGVSDGTMALEPVSREQLVTMMYRYAQLKKYDVSVGKDTNILSYDDAFSISEWAIEAFQWACGAGVINGVNGKLLPKQGANRAELAVMLYRFDKTTVGKYEPSQSIPSTPSYPIIPPHVHIYTYTANNDGTHDKECSCGDSVNEVCSIVDGVCELCGYIPYYVTTETADIASVIKSAPAGSTIVFAEGTYNKIVLDDIDGLWHNKDNNEGTLYQNTLQYAGPGGDEYNPELYPDVYEAKAVKHQTLADNLTIVAEEGAAVTIAGMDIYSDSGLYGVGYGGINPTQATKDMLCVAKNMTISGITFTDDLALKGAFIDGWNIENCTFSEGACVNTNHNSHNKKSAAADVTITGCTFTGIDSDAATQETRIILFKVDGTTISGNTIESAEFNAVQLGGDVTGTVEISGNTIRDTGDRVLRFGIIKAGATVSVSDNTVTSEGDNGQVIKYTTLEDGAFVTLTDNTWNRYDDEMLGYNNGVWRLPVEAPTNTGELMAFLQTVADGSTILLAPVDYSTDYAVNLGGGHFNATLPKNITIIGNPNASMSFAVRKDSAGSVPFDGAMDGWTFKNVNFVGDGFRLKNGATATNIKLEGCTFADGATFYVLAAQGGHVSGAIFDRCEFSDTVNSSANKNAISIQDAENITVDDCIFTNVRNAVNFGSSAKGNMVITDNTVTGTTDRVLRITDSGATYTITGNTCTSIGESAGQVIKIDGVNVDKVTLSNNTWNDCADGVLNCNSGVWTLPVE